MERYEAKQAVIIGGTSGMGLATAKMLLDGGARVLVTGRSQAGLESAQKELGKDAIVVSSDARSLTDIDALASRVKAEFDTFDLLFVNAGFSIFAPLENMTEADLRRDVQPERQGTVFRGAEARAADQPGRLCRPHDLDRQRQGNARPTPHTEPPRLRCDPSLGCSPLSFFLGRFASTRCRPVPSTRRSSAKRFPIKTMAAQVTGQMRGMIPMKRFGTSEEIAKAVLFLAFDATFTTGAELPVDGGWSQL